MTTTSAGRTAITRPLGAASAAGAALGVALVALLGGCTGSAGSTGDRPVTVSLTGNPAARQLAQMLPLSLVLDDAWGQAMTGRLPRPLPTAGERVLEPTVGGVYYWPGTQTLAVYYDDLGQSVPPPGLVPLGVVDTGLDAIADGGRVTVHVEPAG